MGKKRAGGRGVEERGGGWRGMAQEGNEEEGRQEGRQGAGKHKGGLASERPTEWETSSFFDSMVMLVMVRW